MSTLGTSLKWAIIRGISQPIQLISIVIFSRTVGADGYGEFVLFLTIVIMFQAVTGEGVGEAVAQRISADSTNKPSQHRYAGAGMVIRGGLFILASIGILLAKEPINNFVGHEVHLYLISCIGLMSLFQLLRDILRGENKILSEGVVQTLVTVARLPLQVGLILIGLGVLGMIQGLTLSLLIGVFIALILSEISFELPKREEISEIAVFSFKSNLSDVSLRIFNRIDVLLIGYFLTDSAVGAYEAAFGITGVLLLPINGLSKTIFPQLSGKNLDDSREEVKSIIEEALGYAIILSVPVVFGSLVLAGPLLEVLFTPEFRKASIALVIIGMSRGIESIVYVLRFSVTALDMPGIVTKGATAMLLIDIILGVVFVQFLGITGVAIATVVGFIVMLLIVVVDLSKTLSIDFPLEFWSHQIASAMIMAVTLGAITSLLPSQRDLVSVMSLIVFGGALYFVLLSILNSGFKRTMTDLVHRAVRYV
ncbi:oligosaccharide flippase family protein [Haloferax volcanii]|uniref:oligosaccharide flippase family protein n=1 Tax=Haloferax volcanii TaxID=2246 RepID=UPI003D303C61